MLHVNYDTIQRNCKHFNVSFINDSFSYFKVTNNKVLDMDINMLTSLNIPYKLYFLKIMFNYTFNRKQFKLIKGNFKPHQSGKLIFNLN